MQVEYGHDLVAQKKIENENENQRWHVADQLDIGAAYQPEKDASADPAEAHRTAEDACQDGTPKTQTNSVEHPNHKQIGDPSAAFLVITPEILRNDRPIPLVIEPYGNPKADIRRYCENEDRYNNVKRCYLDLFPVQGSAPVRQNNLRGPR